MMKLDFSNMMESRIGERGISIGAIENMEHRINEIDVKLKRDRSEGRLQFMELPYKNVDDIISLANEEATKYENFVLIGIGGSSWGSIALHTALSHPYYNLLPASRRNGRPRFFVIDNCDPDETAGLFDIIDMKKTLVNVVSKSGTTPEPMANFVKCYEMMKRSVGKAYTEHFIITTDEGDGDGVLRRVAEREGIRCLEIPKRVGGRFSVFSPAGLFPAAVSGIDIKEVLNGARHMDEACKKPDIWHNPAYMFAVLEYLAIDKGYNISVLMPYSRKLRHFGNWYMQLWAESLGKEHDRDNNTVNAGSTPLKAIGAADQHSLLQLFNEGPFDKVITFIRVESYENDVSLPAVFRGWNELEYFGGHTLGELMKTEQFATELALTNHRRPNKTIVIPAINSFTVGALMYFFELVTTVMGELLNVNAFDQPGVEEGKRLTYALMGRRGFERERNAIRAKMFEEENKEEKEKSKSLIICFC